MSKSKTIGVRFNGRLLTQIEQHDMNNCELIRTVMQRYFIDDGSSSKLKGSASSASNGYDANLLDLLTNQ